MPFRIVARHGSQTWDLQSTFGNLTLLEQLQHQQIPIKSSCMGKGVCRQCRVRVEKGIAPISSADRKAFSTAQLEQGWRLSCGLRPRTAIEVSFPQIFVFQDNLHQKRNPEGPWWLCCDLGTTGIELAGVDTKGIWAVIKGLNQQVSMGADVMTRLEYAQRNGVKPLFERLAGQLKRLSKKIISRAEDHFTGQIWLAGNSAITSFIAQMPIDSLAVAPYQPQTTVEQTFSLDPMQAHTLPLLHSFVGGDLFAGLFTLWKTPEALNKSWILMDVGTNSEILFWDEKTLFVSSTPAGPAFEGSSISIGMRAEDGAILDPRFDPTSRHWRFKVVSDDVPKGICGTGLIQAIREGVLYGIIQKDGELLDPDGLRFTDNLALTQDDIREFQLAKSAIQTGLEIVQTESSITPQQLYLAGSFGENLPLDECRSLKLLPHLPTTALGNSSLQGTVLWSQTTPPERLAFQEWVDRVTKPIELAMSDGFQAAFVRNMEL